MIIKLLIGIIVLIAIYFYMVHMSKSQQVTATMENIQEGFIPSDKFTGAKKGFVFKMCSNGLGYYLDRKR